MKSRKSPRRLRLLLSTSVCASLLLLSSSTLYSGYYSDYDYYFRRSGKQLPMYDWRWFKAQGLQESLLDPKAVSPAGAKGIMQIMPGTWQDETDRLGIIASPFNARANIYVGVHYMKRMVRFWKAPRTHLERLELAQASYNAGAGNVLKAQTKCGNKRTWDGVRPCLKSVTGKLSEETLDYVRRIKAWFGVLVEG